MHWLAALTYAYVLLTGLAFYSPHLYWIAAMLGGAPTSRFWHPWVALVFLAIAGLDVARLDCRHAHHRGRPPLGRSRWTTTSATKIEDLPPIDRFNLGQKYFFWAMLFAGVVLLLSGAAMWFPEIVPASLRAARRSCCTWRPRW